MLLPTTSEEICKIIYELKDSYSVGNDEIPIKLIKHCGPELAVILEPIINMTLQTAVFPSELKKSIIKLIYKRGNKSDLSNYRPISLLSHFSKIFERIIYVRMYDFLNKCNVLCNNQNGYIKQRNTTRAIYQAITEVLSGVNDNESTFGIFMDLTKAFDSVDYAKLFEKLEIYGVRGRTLELIKSYLHNRKQAVMSEDKQTSEWLETERGVPQGSILGPLLFIIYVNDIPEVTPYAATLFADDTSVIIRSVKDEIENEVISTLNNFDEWFSQNNLKLNISKTKLMEFSYFKNEQRNIKYNDTELITTDAVTFLGLRIDSQLNWKNHVNYLAGKVSSFVYALRVISTSVEVSAGRAAYFAYVHSRLKYGVIFWGSSVEVPRLFVLQKACVRSVFNLDYRESCKETFRVNGILTLTGIYIYTSVRCL